MIEKTRTPRWPLKRAVTIAVGVAVGVVAVVGLATFVRPRAVEDSPQQLIFDRRRINEVDIGDEELAKNVDEVVKMQEWFGSVTRFAATYRIVENLEAQSPRSEGDDRWSNQRMREVQTFHRVTFDPERFAYLNDSQLSNLMVERWDGQKVVGYFDPRRPTQPPNYFYKSDPVEGASGALYAFPVVSHPTTFWFSPRAVVKSVAEVEPANVVCRGVLDYAGQECLVLDVGDYSRWFVGRNDHRLYGIHRGVSVRGETYWVSEEICFSDYREVEEGQYWPHRQSQRRFRREDGETNLVHARTVTVEEMLVNRPATAIYEALYHFPILEGVKIADFRFSPPAVYKHDPKRSPEEWKEILTQVEQNSAEFRKHEEETAEIIGEEAPDLPTGGTWLHSEPVSLRDLEHKRVIIGFSSVGCAPCAAMYSQFSGAENTDADVVERILVFPSFDDPKAVEEVLKEYGVTCPVYISPPSSAHSWGEAFQRYRVRALPTVVEINGSGVLMEHRMGSFQ